MRLAVRIADGIEHGINPMRLSQEMEVEIRVRPNSPASEERGWTVKKRKQGRPVWIKPGVKPAAAVQTRKGWVIVTREIDITNSTRKLALGLGILLLALISLSVWASGKATAPLQETRLAMSRMASGDLDHRLPVRGALELQDAARAFNRMADRVKSMLRTQQELMAGISHELRTPLARLRLETEILRDLGASENRLSAMESDLQELDGLVGDLLEISRLELGAGLGVTEQVDLAKLATEAIRRWPTPAHPVSVIGACVPVRGDRKRLLRVVGNLIQNAGKYAPPGSPITIRLRGGSLEVLDEGPGVPPQELDRLFQPFYRGSKSSTHQGKGLGLGLMLVRQIVEAHGGTVTARNRTGGGLAVLVQLT
jgi:signal transduction histidine kinase